MPLLSVLHQQQRQQADCLAACAAIVLDYLHVPVDYARLLKLLEVEAVGAPFRNLKRLEVLGLSVQLGEGAIDRLIAYLDDGLPVIAFVDTGQLTSYWAEQTDHAVVVIGIESDRVYLNDPEFQFAPQSVSLDEFALAWEEKHRLCAVVGLD